MENWYMASPFGVVTAVTYSCNLKCKHCFAGSPKLEKNPNIAQDMSTEEWFSLIDDLANNSVHEIYFGGGEPFMRTDMIQLIKHARARGLGVTLTTNGTLLTKEIIREMVETGIECVEVSIDGNRVSHDYLRGVQGCHDKAMESIRTMVNCDIYVIISLTLSKKNIPVVDEVIHHARQVGVKEILFMRFIPCGVGRDSKDELYLTEEEYRLAIKDIIARHEKSMQPCEAQDLYGIGSFYKKCQSAFDGFFYPHAGCLASRTYCFVRPDGTVTPCNPLSFPHLVAGNVTQESFINIWRKSMVLQKIRKIRFAELKNCGDCEQSESCLGGCRIMCNEYGKFCKKNCDNCQRIDFCNDATGLCGKKYMYYMRIENE
ncbi:MAG: radical SAM protein [Oscillospiraceae bacterium]|nr:radical SAM protein [Oscillospiraceae bacterium]